MSSSQSGDMNNHPQETSTEKGAEKSPDVPQDSPIGKR